MICNKRSLKASQLCKFVPVVNPKGLEGSQYDVATNLLTPFKITLLLKILSFAFLLFWLVKPNHLEKIKVVLNKLSSR